MTIFFTSCTHLACSGKNLVIFGSPGAAKTLLELGLIDEFLLTICPVVLGSGKSLFDGGEKNQAQTAVQPNVQVRRNRGSLRVGEITAPYNLNSIS